MKKWLKYSLIIVGILIILAVFFITAQNYLKNSDLLDYEKNINNDSRGINEEVNKDCKKVEFTEYFVDPSYVEKVGAIGVVHGSGKFTVPRSYISLKPNLGFDKIPIYAPTDMVLLEGSYYQDSRSSAMPGYLPDYALVFNVGCGVTITFAHLKEVVDSIANQLPNTATYSGTNHLNPIEFEAGDLIGYFIQNTGVSSFDFITQNSNVTNKFGNQARHEYQGGTSLLHAVCPYDFYSEPKRQDYYNLIGSSSGVLFEDPRCGPVSRDFSGTISGLWFLDKEVQETRDYYSAHYMDGDYGSSLPIIGDESQITIGRIGDTDNNRVYSNNPTYKLPSEVNNEHCYQFNGWSPDDNVGWVYFKLINNETMDVVYSKEGECPESFPNNEKRYYR